MENKTLYKRVSEPAMRAKLADEQTLRRKLGNIKIRMKTDLIEHHGGDRTRGYRRDITHLNKTARDIKNQLNKKYKIDSMEHNKEIKQDQ